MLLHGTVLFHSSTTIYVVCRIVFHSFTVRESRTDQARIDHQLEVELGRLRTDFGAEHVQCAN